MNYNKAIAGSTDNNDILVELLPNDSGRKIDLVKSPVKEHFGDKIIECVNNVLDEYNIKDITVQLTDRGALDYAIKARVKTAILRGLENE